VKLHEVLEHLNGDTTYWFRPVSWKGRGQAHALSATGKTVLVPSARGGDPHMTNNPNDLMDDWEVVTPDQVLGGSDGTSRAPTIRKIPKKARS
jgi:hypothetical protein